MVCTMCLVIFAIGAFISLSIPFNTLPYYSYTAEIQFNEAMFTGSVNDFSVEDITALRVSLAIFCPTSLISFLTDVQLGIW